LLSIQTRNTIVPVRLQSFSIQPAQFLNFVKSTSSATPYEKMQNVLVPVKVNKNLNSIECPGIQVKGV
ncbi:unnamed protein product, partial [Allacma fusca]